jgi:hypothetical protein
MNPNENNQVGYFDVSRFKVEKHVRDALTIALDLSKNGPLNAGHLLNAALIMSSPTPPSPAFERWASFFALEKGGNPTANSRSRVDLKALPLDSFLAVSFKIAEPFFQQGKTFMGRAFITIALLAVDDPSLEEISELARNSIAMLRDRWFLFVTSSGSFGNREFWINWYKKAGVRPPLPTYLLTWDTKRGAGDQLLNAIKEFERKRTVVLNWSVGDPDLVQGDRVFFMRQSEDNPGICGAGYVVSDVRKASNPDKTKPNNSADYYADVRWEGLREAPLIPRETLVKETGEDKLWKTNESGVRIPDEIAKRLEDLWEEAAKTLFLGPDACIATDIWTLNDALGYKAYAYAIYRFIMHHQTKPPLTISIQAPWGGGKTSLMRMVQQQLDPEALSKLGEDSGKQRTNLTIKQALQEINEWIRSGDNKGLPTIPKDVPHKLLTVWFNAWKYESTNQVWAGLADAIMKQITARLPILERERFWLRLSLRRVDAEKIRHHIHERILNCFWRYARWWLLGTGLLLFTSIAATAVGLISQHPIAMSIGRYGGYGIVSSVIISITSSIWNYHTAKQNVDKEPASVSLKEYLDIPDYNKELGFVHHVETDLHRVFATVPEEHQKIVVFIDDLDRCSPVKVAQVLEAVNLFLAGEFPNCIFLLGMDSEMVAAALQAAHRDMLICLPTDASIPLGWRFMDKFVQLPFLIPLPEDNDVTRYTKSLFNIDSTRIPEVAIQDALDQAEKIQSRSEVDHEMAELQIIHNLDDIQRGYIEEQLETRVVQRVLDQGIETFTDENPEIRRVISAANSHFCGNPRELKRFVNVFRFNYFIWWARRAREVEIPTIDQLLRWTVLSMKWPEAIRWLRRGGGTDWCVKAVGGKKKHLCSDPGKPITIN